MTRNPVFASRSRSAAYFVRPYVDGESERADCDERNMKVSTPAARA